MHVGSADGGPGATVHVRYATEHRAGLLLRGAMLCDRITGTGTWGAALAKELSSSIPLNPHLPGARAPYPLKDNRLILRSQPLDDTPEAAHTAHMVNQARARRMGRIP
jgi:hypothetical protein